MITCRELIRFMELTAPPELAEEWDNIGLLVGSEESAVSKILLCMDITSASIREAVSKKAEMIITHHPVIFKGLKSLTEDNFKGRLLCELIRENISVYAAHTNLDFAQAGVNTGLAEVLGLASIETLHDGPGKTGFLACRKSLQEYIRMVKEALDVPFIRVVGRAENGIHKIAVFSGSFDDNLEAIKQSGADVLVTGDLKYHTALDAKESGMCIIDAGHFNTEKIVLPLLANTLRIEFPEVEVHCFYKGEDPFITY